MVCYVWCVDYNEVLIFLDYFCIMGMNYGKYFNFEFDKLMDVLKIVVDLNVEYMVVEKILVVDMLLVLIY